MNDRMTPIPFSKLMHWILSEKNSTFGIKPRFKTDSSHPITLFDEKLEVPFGPAAGPHTQLAQNIITSYIAGARFFELKTVQTLDGEDLPVSKPCINAMDECYNVEWSTELTVNQAFDEYTKAWFVLKLLSKEWELGDDNGFIFNMSVGYDLEGIQSPKIDNFIESLKDATDTPIWKECMAWTLNHLYLFKNIDREYVYSISSKVSHSITLSTLHGCPPEEIERIASYLLSTKQLHTYIKCNPTLLGYSFARKTMDELGYDYLIFDEHHFNNDLQFEDAIPMFKRLQHLADTRNLYFGVKLTNTFPVKIGANELPGEEMYMSGRSLFPLTIALADKLAKTFDGRLRVSFSGGVDAFNIKELLNTGIYPITLATTLLKPGGYNRLTQMASLLLDVPSPPATLDLDAITTLAGNSLSDSHYTKLIKPLPSRKASSSVPLLDCTFSPCSKGCPIEQDVPTYIRLCSEGNYLDALKVIVDKNPLPFITGTICNHRCMDKCRRNFYEEEISIRDIKRLAADKAFDDLLKELPSPLTLSEKKVAIVGGGPAGLAASYFLSKEGLDVTLFEKKKSLGGIVRHIVPSFRIDSEWIEKDIRLIKHYGTKFIFDKEITDLQELKDQGFDYIIVAIGAYKLGNISLEEGNAMNVLAFLERSRKADSSLKLGKHVAIIGGGNTAMDAARAAKRSPGVENVSLIYRRTKRYMPADPEELSLALEDDILFKELLSPIRLKDGLLHCQKMILGEADSSGRRSPKATGEIVTLPTDTLIAAVGESVDDTFFTSNSLPLDARGNPHCDASTLEITNNIFVAGDAVSGPATVVEGIRDARMISDEILKRENLASLESVVISSNSPEDIYDKKGVLGLKTTPEEEGARCLECDKVCECCVDVCPNRANIALVVDSSTQILHIDAMCNECGNCTVFCPYASAPYKEKFTLFNTKEELMTSTNEGLWISDIDSKQFCIRLDGTLGDFSPDTFDQNPGILSLITTLFDHYSYLI